MAVLEDKWEVLKTLGLWARSIGTSSDREHIFITGAPRSGTTLVKTILAAHPAIEGGDYESTGIFKPRNLYQYSCGETENGWIQISAEEASNLVDFYDQLADALLEYYGGEYFVDKIWPHKYRLKYVFAKFPRARWIHMIRDGRDAYCSACEHPNVPQSELLSRFARYWDRSNRLIERIVPAEKRVRVRYEDLARTPRCEIERIMDFLELSVDSDQFHPVASGQVPSIRDREYHQRLGEPVNANSVGRRKEELGTEEEKTFIEIAGSRLRRYGYTEG